MSKSSKLGIQKAISAKRIIIWKMFLCKNTYFIDVILVPSFHLSARSSLFFLAFFFLVYGKHPISRSWKRLTLELFPFLCSSSISSYPTHQIGSDRRAVGPFMMHILRILVLDLSDTAIENEHKHAYKHREAGACTYASAARMNKKAVPWDTSHICLIWEVCGGAIQIYVQAMWHCLFPY